MRLPAIKWPDTRAWLAIASVLQVNFALALLAWKAIPQVNHDVFVLIIGQVVGAGFVMVFGYYFGTSKGAADVRAQLGQVIDKLPAQPSAVPAPPPEN